MSIDWNTAPEGATHWEPTGPDFYEGWMKKEGTDWFYWSESGHKWINGILTCDVSAEREATFEARPQEAWDGHGLPPTGLLVEWKAGLDHEWRRVTVLAYANGDAWLQPEDGDSFIVGNPANFRRIRTPEQIAAEEREKAIEEMCFAEETLTVKQAKALYDAGYRRQESST
ncbi:hypothetical protein [Pseudomonas aeruginosa]|uniref:hypothetical protein n=1 Tax=Pseudomonas aeruginosa TaxID=287 RepID=UPI00053E8399|nr:hypothetical protein [Pseudomonas aeruginosa]MBA5723283.1 hypothetical protein [Pseudomonas aeruginosa]MCC9291224.1 hypothetical protein [Pseudomonas aeruginosa]HCL3550381.1 hypothetical protein [Pseudomonas aeruginosa]HDY6051928.1 hypothetical protein [Pseudomonas aeruginosa]HDY6325296.1 hypothetical protein [Pseudomonas aeruginosa]